MENLDQRLTKLHKQALSLLKDKKIQRRMLRHFQFELAYHAISIEQSKMSKEEVKEYIKTL